MLGVASQCALDERVSLFDVPCLVQCESPTRGTVGEKGAGRWDCEPYGGQCGRYDDHSGARRQPRHELVTTGKLYDANGGSAPGEQKFQERPSQLGPVL